MTMETKAISPLTSDGTYRWEHEGEKFALRFPSVLDDLKIAARRASFQATYAETLIENPLSSYFMDDLPAAVATLDVCLFEHPDLFTTVSGERVPWRLAGDDGKPRALNSERLQDYPKSAWTRAVREVRTFLGFFRPIEFPSDPGAGGKSA